MVTTDVFPADWLIMRIVLNDVLLRATKELSAVMLRHFVKVRMLLECANVVFHFASRVLFFSYVGRVV